ncbi:MAG TPA: hypothetical protein PLB67_10190 [Candidatus Hydrogenedentes bacterium]|jgi:uncharacterized protein YjeT (DUF2065 family)|nr:hypothetical protein [Candidatus Hydrogenedentota bacterium]MDY0031982.1 hypothetical protein [FCB group bacterium]NLT60591.1 hypothetical protein [Candidatus Hydrogenedentota bacterium]HNZ20055.1 hypothetical protein [Candidatus Hydrogenedentota bacterium]HOH35536.1 hypothetical protein [Candidatus Hydrogenedentota bacterium]
MGPVVGLDQALKEAPVLSIIIRGMVGFVFVVLGVVGLVSPLTTRSLISKLLEKAPVRMFGVLLMLLGAGVFRVAGQVYLPLAAQVLGVALFMVGGVHILIPDFAIVMNEWWVARKTVWERLISIVYLILAALLLVPQEGVPLRQWFTPRLPAAYESEPEDAEPESAEPEPAAPDHNAQETAPAPE